MPGWRDNLIEIGHRCGFKSLPLDSDGIDDGIAQESEAIHVLRKLHETPLGICHARSSNFQDISSPFLKYLAIVSANRFGSGSMETIVVML